MAAIYMVLEETVGRLRAVYISAHHGEQLYRSAARRQRDPEVYSTALAPRPTPRQARSGFDAVMVCTTARKAEPQKKPKRSPVTVEHLLALRAGLTMSDSFDSAVWGVATVAFWGCRR